MGSKIEWVKKWNHRSSRWFVPLILVAGLLGYLIRGGGGEVQSSHKPHQSSSEMSTDTVAVKIWTCSMHPQIRKPGPGDCPICGMDLVPVRESQEEQLGPRQLKLSPTAVKLAEIEVAPVERRSVVDNIRLAGKVEFDETRVKYISAWISGRLDRLYVDYTGTYVKKGTPLVKLFSPQLIVAQQELIQARQTLNKLGRNSSSKIAETVQRTAVAARGKLGLWGLTPSQIQEIEKRKSPAQHLTIFSPINGVVIHKNAVEGLYVKTGTRIYTIADLSWVWVKLDAYESNLTGIKLGQTVKFETESYPGEIFSGKVAFIDPVVNPQTRTVKVRVNVPNSNYKLKPEMFVWANLLSPMDASTEAALLVIPETAPLLTGKRAVVYVAVKDTEGIFEGREVVLGSRIGSYFAIKEGLTEGEMVVVNGAFKIDSDLQIRAKPSMMHVEGGTPLPTHHHSGTSRQEGEERGHKHLDHQPDLRGSSSQVSVPKAFSDSIDSLTSAYLAMQQALSRDDYKKARQEVQSVRESFDLLDMKLLSGNDHAAWMNFQKLLLKNIKKMTQSRDIENLRSHFADFSVVVTEVVKRYGGGIKESIYRFHCPMALNNKGAYWLQDHPDTRNPYFGASMLKCQDLKEKLVLPK